MEQEAFADSHWGISVYSPSRNRFLFEQNQGRNFRPASNMKILTTLMAFDLLGPDYRFDTDFYYSGTIQDGVLNGNLLVLGRGDPSFSGNYSEGAFHTREFMDPIVGAIKRLGIGQVRGNLVALIGFFDDQTIQKSWEWDDLGFYYATPITPLSLHDGWIHLTLTVTEEGLFGYKVFPRWTPGFELHTQVTHHPGESDWELTRTWGTNHMVLKGNLPPCTEIEITRSAWNPNLQFLATLRGVLAESGIDVSGELILSRSHNPDDLQLITVHTSADLSDLAKTLMGKSQNHYADAFLKTLAARYHGDGNFEMGAELAARFMNRVATPRVAAGHNVRDGSGLSGQNYLKPAQIVAMLRYGLRQAYARQWIATFPVMGVDGTLKKRGSVDGLTAGRVWAKTGYIYRTRCLSGYLETLAGEPLVFSIMTNNYSVPTSRINQAQDEICSILRRLKPNRAAKRDSALRFWLSEGTH